MKQKDILFILISSFVVVAAWVGFNLYHKWVTTTISPDLQLQINPIESSFDRDTIQKLKQRNHIAPDYEASTAQLTPTSQPGKPTPTIEPTPELEPTIPLELPPAGEPTTAVEPPPGEGGVPEGDL